MPKGSCMLMNLCSNWTSWQGLSGSAPPVPGIEVGNALIFPFSLYSFVSVPIAEQKVAFKFMYLHLIRMSSPTSRGPLPHTRVTLYTRPRPIPASQESTTLM